MLGRHRPDRLDVSLVGRAGDCELQRTETDQSAADGRDPVMFPLALGGADDLDLIVVQPNDPVEIIRSGTLRRASLATLLTNDVRTASGRSTRVPDVVCQSSASR